MKRFFLRVVASLLVPAIVLADPAWASVMIRGSAPILTSLIFQAQAINPPEDVGYTGDHGAVVYREEAGQLVRKRSRRWFMKAVAGTAAATAIAASTPVQALAQTIKQTLEPIHVPTEAAVPNAENNTHYWFQDPLEEKPIQTVNDVIEFVLRRHLGLARGMEQLQKRRRETRLPLLPRSTFNVHTDLNHPGPEAAYGTSHLQTGIRDLLAYPIEHWENSPNRIDSASGSSRPWNRIKDLFRGGVEIHSSGQKAEYEALRVKAVTDFKTAAPELLQEPAEKFVREAVDMFFTIADWDVQIYYKKQEISNWDRAIEYFRENQRPGA